MMTKNLRLHNRGLIWGTLLILLPGFGLVSCNDLSESDNEQISQALSDSLLSSTESWDVEIEIIEEGLTKVRISGSYAATFNLGNRQETRISGPVSIQVLDTSGSVTTRVASDRAVYMARESELELFGNVTVDSGESRLTSEYLLWDEENNRISSPRFVILTTSTDSIASNGFEGSADLTEYHFTQGRGQFITD